jgi:hypothetical protein
MLFRWKVLPMVKVCPEVKAESLGDYILEARPELRG